MGIAMGIVSKELGVGMRERRPLRRRPFKVCDTGTQAWTGRKGKPKIGGTFGYVGTYSAVRHAGTKKRDESAAKGGIWPL